MYWLELESMRLSFGTSASIAPDFVANQLDEPILEWKSRLTKILIAQPKAGFYYFFGNYTTSSFPLCKRFVKHKKIRCVPKNLMDKQFKS